MDQTKNRMRKTVAHAQTTRLLEQLGDVFTVYDVMAVTGKPYHFAANRIQYMRKNGLVVNGPASMPQLYMKMEKGNGNQDG